MSNIRRIFISYSHADETFKQEIEKHLSPLLLLERVEKWNDRSLYAGQSLYRKISENINLADVVLLLISCDYLSSDSCVEEMRAALLRSGNASAVTIPVIIRPCDWQILPLGEVLAVPKDGHAVSKWIDRDEAWKNVAENIRFLIDDWETATAKAIDDPQPTEAIPVSSQQAGEAEGAPDKPPPQPDRWVFRREVNDPDWEDAKNRILSHLISISKLDASSEIHLDGRRWGSKLLLDVKYGASSASRRIWLEDVGGTPNYPGYQLRVAADNRLAMAAERLRWLMMVDGSKLLIKLGTQEPFTPESYAERLWILIKLAVRRN